MNWNRSEVIGVSNANCARCGGLGLVRGRGHAQVPCSCSLRAIFQACYRRFVSCAKRDKGASAVNLERIGTGRSSHMTFGRKTEEYIADFYLTARRTLTASEWHVFNVAYLLGADWKLAHRFLKMPRTNFMQACYRLEAKLGRAFRECAPYPLFPLDEYFSPVVRGASIPATVPPGPRPAPLRPPLAAA